FIWVALTGNFVLINFTFGFLLSFFIMWIVSRGSGNKRYFNRIPKLLQFGVYFLYEMTKANLQVAFDVITPRYKMHPGIVKYPLTASSNLEITLLANFLSLTPGTLIIDVSDDKKVLYVHVMYLKDKESFVSNVQNGLERKLLDVLR